MNYFFYILDYFLSFISKIIDTKSAKLARKKNVIL